MNDLELGPKRRDPIEPPENEPESQGPSLILLYSLIVLAILIATGLAMLIVLPFHIRAERYRRVSEVRLVQSMGAFHPATHLTPQSWRALHLRLAESLPADPLTGLPAPQKIVTETPIL